MSNKQNTSRRNFLKMLGLAGVAIPASKVVGHIGKDELLQNEVKYGGFVVRKHAALNKPYHVDNRYQRFSQKNILFSRALWDPEVQAAMAAYREVPINHMKDKNEGFTQLEYALYCASWTVALALGTAESSIGAGNRGLGSWNPLQGTRLPLARSGGKWIPAESGWSPQEVTDIVKTAAMLYGASSVGVTEIDERWIYSHRFTRFIEPKATEAPIIFDDIPEPLEKEDLTLVIPKSMKYVVALAFEMDADGISTYNSGIGSAATGMGYSMKAFTSATLAEFIRGLGYNAIPSSNCTGMSIPMAIDAGLGELGRHGLMITPRYGPRVRLAKVITDLPLVPDEPITFGVTEFCEICGKCADACPSGSILPVGQGRTTDPIDISTNPGVLKWPVNCTTCYEYWQINGMDCSICLRICPFTKPDNWLHDATRTLISAKSGVVDKVLLSLDDASRFGEQMSPKDYWKKKRNFT